MNYLSLCFSWNGFASTPIFKRHHCRAWNSWSAVTDLLCILGFENCWWGTVYYFNVSMLVNGLVFFLYSFLDCLFGLYCSHLDYAMRVTLSWWDLLLATTWEQCYVSLCTSQHTIFQPVRIQNVCLSIVASLGLSCGMSNWGFLTCECSLISCSWSSSVFNNRLYLNMAPDHGPPNGISLHCWPICQRNHSFTNT